MKIRQQNFESIRDGLKNFSAANNANHSNFTDEHFTALAYEGLNETSYYLNQVCKNPDGSAKMIDFYGNMTPLNTVYSTLNSIIQTDSNIFCN